MVSIHFTSNRGTIAVRKLREKKLKNGLPFMINTKELASNQCYMEYPNGTIKLMTVINSTKEIDFLRELSLTEADNLRSRLHLSHP